MEQRRNVFQAIADPTRRQILDILARDSMNVNAIAARFAVSRQAISLHLKILHECNLIAIQKEGRERICHPQLQALEEVNEWTAHFKHFWSDKLIALKSVLEEEDPKNK